MELKSFVFPRIVSRDQKQQKERIFELCLTLLNDNIALWRLLFLNGEGKMYFSKACFTLCQTFPNITFSGVFFFFLQKLFVS